MNLESRVFRNFYPAQAKSMWWLRRRHGIISRSVKAVSDFDHIYTISSPSAQEGVRKYPLGLKQKLVQNPSLSTTALTGHLGEILFRIYAKEWLRRISDELGIENFSFEKQDRIIGKTHQIIGKDDYNLEIHNYGLLLDEPIAEFDGLITYENQRLTGVLLCEAKSASTTYQHINSKESKAKLMKKIIEPMHDIYPNHQKDFLLMLTPKQLFSQAKDTKGNVLERFGRLHEYLASHDIGLIPFVYNENTDNLYAIASRVRALHKANNNAVPLEHISRFQDNTYIENGNFLYLLRKTQIRKILERTNGSYKVLFEN